MKFTDRPTILVDGIFNDSMSSKFMENIMALEEADEESVAVFINSPGGSIDSLKMMVDIIQSTEVHVTTIATGLVASCGTLLLMAGDYRLSFPSASIMSHQYSWASRGKHHELIASRSAQDQTQKFMLEHYKVHTGLPEAKILKELLPAEDVWLTAEEALGFRLIDEICAPYHKPVGFKEKVKYRAEHDKKRVAEAYQVLKDAGRIRD